MRFIRNVAFGLVVLCFVVTSASYAQNITKGSFTATYIGPAKNQSGLNGGIVLDCTTVTQCSFKRDGIVPPGESRVGIVVTTAVDDVSVHVELGVWLASRCGPDPTTPDISGAGDVPLMAAGTYIISFQSEALLPAGTTFSQKWFVSTTDTTVSCGVSYCVNSVAGGAAPAPADCDQP